MELTTSWKEEGLAEGLAKGLERGRHEESQQLVIRLLQRRCGTLPPPLMARLRALSLTEMESLAEALLDFTSLRDLEHWLAQR